MKAILILFIFCFPSASFAQIGWCIQNGKTIEDVKESLRSVYDEIIYERQEKVIEKDKDGKDLTFTILHYSDRKTGFPFEFVFGTDGICFESNSPYPKYEKAATIKRMDSLYPRMKDYEGYGWIISISDVLGATLIDKPELRYITLSFIGL